MEHASKKAVALATEDRDFTVDRKERAVIDRLHDRNEDEICSEPGISQHTLDTWRQQFLEGSGDALSGCQRRAREHGLITIILMGSALLLLLVYFILQSRLDAAYVDILPLGAAVTIMLAAFIQEWHATRTGEMTLKPHNDQANNHQHVVEEFIPQGHRAQSETASNTNPGVC